MRIGLVDVDNTSFPNLALDKIVIGRGKIEWGAEEGNLYFVIHLGKRLS